MHQLHWDLDDKIHSSCYDSYYEFEYDLETNSMICIDKLDEIVQECQNKNHDVNDVDEWNQEDEDHSDNQEIENDNEEDIEIQQGVKLPFAKYGFDEKLGADDKLNHIPIWNNNKCTICEYQYDEKKLGIYAKKFDPVYYMN